MDSRERFIEKARTWPRVETADQLARLLSGVKARRWREYSYVANPPCHASSSRESFAFGDASGGGLVVYCWACEGETVEQAENALGVALQVRRQDGSLRYRDGGVGRSTRPLSTAAPTSPPQVQRLHATPLGEGITLADFFSTRHWLLSRGKGKPASAKGGSAAWRQSRDPERGGILLARHGGVVRETDGRGPRTSSAYSPGRATTASWSYGTTRPSESVAAPSRWSPWPETKPRRPWATSYSSTWTITRNRTRTG